MRTVPHSWRSPLATTIESPWFQELLAFVEQERQQGPVYPPEDRVFAALEATPFEAVRVVLLGQDPYHGPGQADGLAFSVRPGVALPPSLRNMLRELKDDLRCSPPAHGCLEPWAAEGVLLLNAILTVRQASAGSHRGRGWERFSDAVITALDARKAPLVFALWGGYAKKKAALVKSARHRVLEGVHPSPLSASAGFFGSRPFSRINQALEQLGQRPIDWQLPSP